MADFTLKNLREVKDAAAAGGLGDDYEARFPGGDLGATDTGISHQVFGPDKRGPIVHRHDRAEEVVVVLRGSGTAKLDDETVALAPLDALRVAPAVARGFQAGGDGLELLIFGPRHQGDAAVVPGEEFWADA